MQTHTTRKAAASAYGLPGRWVTVTVLPQGNSGRNARGTTGAKRGWGGGVAKGAKMAKRQGSNRMGNTPYCRISRMGQWI